MKKKIIYILGTPRCGSTIISNIFNEINSTISVGELNYIWDRGIKNNWTCGNGKDFHEEEFWIEVMKRFKKKNKHSFEKIYKLYSQKIFRTRDFLFNSKQKINNMITIKYDEYIKIMDILYEVIFEVSGATIIVDSSKTVLYGLLLKNIKKFDIYFLHIIRDPRAVTYSRVENKKKQYTNKNNYIHMGKGITVYKSVRDWIGTNIFIEKYFKNNRYYFLKYEEFTDDPMLTINKIMNYFKIYSENPIKNNSIILSKQNIAFSGNPIRNLNGKIIVNKDQKWLNSMKKSDKRFVTLLTLPQLLKYKYEIFI